MVKSMMFGFAAVVFALMVISGLMTIHHGIVATLAKLG